MVSVLRRALSFSFCLFSFVASATSNSVVGDYFFKQNHYSLSYQAYKEQFTREPSITNLGRLADITFLLKGKEESLAMLKAYFTKHKHRLSDTDLKRLKDKWNYLGSFFETEEAQNLYIQAKKKMEMKEFDQACNLSHQALTREPLHLKIQRQVVQCEKKLDHLPESPDPFFVPKGP